MTRWCCRSRSTASGARGNQRAEGYGGGQRLKKLALADVDVVRFLAGQPVKKIHRRAGPHHQCRRLTASPLTLSLSPGGRGDLSRPCRAGRSAGPRPLGRLRLHPCLWPQWQRRQADPDDLGAGPTDKNAFDLVERLEERLGRPEDIRYDLSYTITTESVGVGITPDKRSHATI